MSMICMFLIFDLRVVLLKKQKLFGQQRVQCSNELHVVLNMLFDVFVMSLIDCHFVVLCNMFVIVRFCMFCSLYVCRTVIRDVATCHPLRDSPQKCTMIGK